MYAKKRRITPLLVVLLLLLIIGTTGTTVAKYIHSTQLSSKVTFTAKLAESIKLLESKAIRNKDGSYTLETENAVNKNEYMLLPGLDVPKDPYITITGKTPIKAYLFLEVYYAIEDTAISFELTDDWKPVMVEGKQLVGQNNGMVYVYTAGKTDPVAIDNTNCPASPLKIIKDDTVKVSQKLDTQKMTTFNNQHLDFYACLSEVPTNEGAPTDLKIIYQNAYPLQS